MSTKAIDYYKTTQIDFRERANYSTNQMLKFAEAYNRSIVEAIPKIESKIKNKQLDAFKLGFERFREQLLSKQELQNGDKVHYAPAHYKEEQFENGIVKSIAPNGGVFVVYNCGGEWDKFMNYTAANTSLTDLVIGWKNE